MRIIGSGKGVDHMCMAYRVIDPDGTSSALSQKLVNITIRKSGVYSGWRLWRQTRQQRVGGPEVGCLIDCVESLINVVDPAPVISTSACRTVLLDVTRLKHCLHLPRFQRLNHLINHNYDTKRVIVRAARRCACGLPFHHTCRSTVLLFDTTGRF